MVVDSELGQDSLTFSLLLSKASYFLKQITCVHNGNMGEQWKLCFTLTPIFVHG